ncbi:MAG: L,D-transpeptidase family protein [Elusimicrobiota bacterium]
MKYPVLQHGYKLFLATCLLILFSKYSQARFLGLARPGGAVIGKVSGAQSATVNGRDIPVKDGFFVFGFDYADRGKYRFVVNRENTEPAVREINLVKGGNLENLTIQSENRSYNRVLKNSTGTRVPYFKQGFTEPVPKEKFTNRAGTAKKIRPSTGEIEISLVGETPVFSVSRGSVKFTGGEPGSGQVMIDHGLGLVTLYRNLEEITVSRGDKVYKNQQIGIAGKKRETGESVLRWAARWKSKRLNPLFLLDGSFKYLSPETARERRIVISIEKQRLYLYEDEQVIREYTISTAKKGPGTAYGSDKTPPGLHQIETKIGEGTLPGNIFVGRRDTNELAQVSLNYFTLSDTLIITRIMHLKGLEPGLNRGRGVDSYRRNIYIHGTQVPDKLGTPSTSGCIWMEDSDLIELFNLVDEGTFVDIIE